MMAAIVVVAAALCSLQGLQMLERPANAKGGAVEVAPSQLEREQKLARQHQLPAPGREGPTANSQYILRAIQALFSKP